MHSELYYNALGQPVPLFASLVTVTGNGFFNPAGYLRFRVRVLSFTSGTVNVTLRSSVKHTVSLVYPVGQFQASPSHGKPVVDNETIRLDDRRMSDSPLREPASARPSRPPVQPACVAPLTVP